MPTLDLINPSVIISVEHSYSARVRDIHEAGYRSNEYTPRLGRMDLLTASHLYCMATKGIRKGGQGKKKKWEGRGNSGERFLLSPMKIRIYTVSYRPACSCSLPERSDYRYDVRSAVHWLMVCPRITR